MNSIKVGGILGGKLITLAPTQTIESALRVMQEHSISSVVIVDDKNVPIGIFTQYDYLRVIANKGKKGVNTLLEDVMSKELFSIHENVYIHDAYIMMEQRGVRHIVVTDSEKKYLGIVTEGDFLRHLGFKNLVQEKTILEAMNKSILSVDMDMTIVEVVKLMSERRCNYVVVMDGETVKSIVNERDIANIPIDDAIDEKGTLSQLITSKIYSIDEKSDLYEASKLMQEHGVHQLVVLNEKSDVLGIIGRHDILKAIHGAYFDFLIETIEAKTKNEELLKKQKEELEKLANYDMLTNLPNRLLLKKMLKKSVANASRNSYSSVFLLLDLDRFKDINDSYGHTIGDELLKNIANILVRNVREGDIVARLGGDEFAIVLEHVEDDRDIAKIVHKLLKQIRSSIALSNGARVSIESSAGIVVIPKDSKDVEKIIQYADSALSHAKKDGHGLYRFYTDEMTQSAIKKIAYENALRNAVENGELELYYQPQVHIESGRIIGAEALLRWKYIDRMIPPEIFIPISDETGLINNIGEWVLKEACIQGKKWLESGYNITVAVNISANQFKYQNIVELISNVLKHTKYSAEKLEIEITETSLMQKEKSAVEVLHALRAKGIRLAIDDFGTGYSSLAYLKRFPIDVLKIDKSFIDDIPYDKESTALVSAIIEMGKALGFQVLAEGIEYKEQFDFLKENGCHIYQGFIKSKPVCAKEFEKLLDAQKKSI